MKLVKTVWKVADENWRQQPVTRSFAVEWFESQLNFTKNEIEKLFKEFRLSEALKIIYSLIWDDFCSWYLEWIKPEYGQPIDFETYQATITFFEELAQILHPFMPFITEEIYHLLKEQKDDLCIKQFTLIEEWSNDTINAGSTLKNYISKIRDFRAANNIKNSEKIEKIGIPFELFQLNKNLLEIACKQANAKDLRIIIGPSTPPIETLALVPNGIKLNTKEEFNAQTSGSTTINTTIPINGCESLLTVNQEIDFVNKKAQLLKDLEYQKGFLLSVEKKLGNERFVQNARPEVIEMERKKQVQANANIDSIEKSLADIPL